VHRAEVLVKNRSVNLLEKYFTGETIDYKHIFGITIPLFVDQAFLIIMSLLNTAMISSAGVAAVSAVSMVDSLNLFFINVFIALATGGTVIVAQYKGAKNPEMVAKTATQAITSVAIASILISAIVILIHTPTLNILFGKAEADVFYYAKIYLIGSCISYPFIAVFQAVCGSLRGIGQSKPVLNLSLFMNLTNTALNLLLILVFQMGIMGLVIATITARVLGMVASVIYLKHNKAIHFRMKDTFHFDFAILKKILFIGLPFAAEQLFFNGGKLLTQTYIVQMGTLALAANAIGSSVVLLFQIGPNALCISLLTVVGQCIGRRNIKDARKFVKSFLGLSSILFVVTALTLMPFFPAMMKMFGSSGELSNTILTLVIITAVTQPFLWSISFLLPSALRAAGDSNFTSIISMLSMWLFRVTLGYILGITFGLGILGVWIAMISEWGIRGTIFLWRFKGEKWYAHKLV
jgi:putative MATE family efflux protein